MAANCHCPKLDDFLEETLMKYMIEYIIRNTGLTHEQNFEGAEALLTAFSKWKPEDGLSIHAFVSTAFVSKFNYWNDVDVVPVIDVSEAVAIAQSSLAWARSSSKG
jgi:hypothetical protein